MCFASLPEPEPAASLPAGYFRLFREAPMIAALAVGECMVLSTAGKYPPRRRVQRANRLTPKSEFKLYRKGSTTWVVERVA